MKKTPILISMLLAVLLSACGAVTPLPPSAVESAAPSPVVTITPPVVLPTSLPTPEVLPSPVSGGGYPGGALQARADLASRLNVPLEQISISGITPKDWSDSCLGLGRPDEGCAQMITPGYLVILTAGPVQYEYHTDSAGNNIRLAPSQSVPAAGVRKPVQSLSGPVRTARYIQSPARQLFMENAVKP